MDTTAAANNKSIIVIMADQLGQASLNEGHIATPFLDSLAESGRVYQQAYCSFPLCTPSRSSMLTGKMPHQLGAMGNDQHDNRVGTDPNSMGHWFAKHGYRTVWAGKYHAPSPDCDPDAGFEIIHPFGDAGLLEKVSAFLEEASPDEPFLLIASWDDPHSICEYARNQPMPYGDIQPQDTRDCPPLPANFFTPQPLAMRKHKETTAAMYGTEEYTPQQWRHYRSVYAQLVERLDQQWAKLAVRLRQLGVTVVVTSDHGDGDAAHGWNQKTSLIQESIHVPLVVAGPSIEAEQISRPVNVSMGLLGALCDLAGIESPPDVPSWSEDEPVVVQTRFRCSAGWGQGRAIIDGRYKYVVYTWGKDREQLFDVIDDPRELRNLAEESAFDETLEQMRQKLFDWCRANDDNFMVRKLVWPKTAADMHQEIFDPPY